MCRDQCRQEVAESVVTSENFDQLFCCIGSVFIEGLTLKKEKDTEKIANPYSHKDESCDSVNLPKSNLTGNSF